MEEQNSDRLEIVAKMSIEQVTKSVTTLKQELNSLGKDIKNVSLNFDSLGNSTGFSVTTKNINEASGAAKKLGKSLSAGINLGKIYLLWNVTKRLRSQFIDLVKYSMDFIETTNKFEVAMRNASDKAYAFQDKLSNSFGMARTDMMEFQATYKNIMSSIPGLTNDMAEDVSETLVGLGLDYASLFNVSTESAMSKIQAALVGSVKPIRSDSGYDITEATIGAKATELGLESSVRNLNQMEKRILRIIVLMDQMRASGAMQDMARTIEQPSNQVKVFTNQLKELKTWLGNVFIGTFGQIMPYINGFVMALVQIVKTLAIFVGYTNTGSGLAEGLEIAEDASDGISSGIGSAASSAKELKKTLMGFDVLNVINTPSKSSGGGGAGGIDASVDPKLLNALKEYDYIMGNVRMKAMDIRDRILEWLGFTLELDEEGNLIGIHLKDGYTNLEKIKDAAISIGIAIAGWKLTNFLKSLDVLEGIPTWKSLLGIAGTTIGVYLTVSASKIIGKEGFTAEAILKTLLGSGAAGLSIGFATGNPVIGITVGIALTVVNILFGIDKKYNLTKSLLDPIAEALGYGSNYINYEDGFLKLTFKGLKLEAEGASLAVKRALRDDQIKKYLENAEQLESGTIPAVNAIPTFMSEEDMKAAAIAQRRLAYELELKTAKENLVIASRKLKTAESELNKVRDKLLSVTENYDLATEKAKKAADDLRIAEEKNKISGQDLFNQVKDGTLTYANMTTVQKEVYNAYLQNVQANEQLEQASKDLNVAENQLKNSETERIIALRNEKVAQLETAAAVAGSKGDYKEFYDALESAYTNGEITASDAMRIIKNATKDMSDDQRKTFEENIPQSVRIGMQQYEQEIKNQKSGILKAFGDIMTAIKKDASGKITIDFDADVDFTNMKKQLQSSKALFDKLASTPIIGNAYKNVVSSLQNAIDKIAAKGYALGGFPDIGELFVAREAGPELVGTIGGRNAVMNNDQIVQAVSSGVANAVSNVLGSNGGTYQLIIDGEQITNVVQRRMARQANITGMAMGV